MSDHLQRVGLERRLQDLASTEQSPAGRFWLQFSNLQSETTLLLRSAAFLDMSVLVTAQDLLAEAAGKVRQSQP